MTRWQRRWPVGVVVVVGAVLVVVGTAVFLTHQDTSVTVGFASYRPLPQTTVVTGGTFLADAAVAGLAVAVVGLLLVATVVGYLLGRRTTARRD